MSSGYIPSEDEPGPDEIVEALREAVFENPRLRQMPAEEVTWQLVLDGRLQQEPSPVLVAEMLDALEADELQGTKSRDEINGTNVNDQIAGLGDHDGLYGSQGDDRLEGGPGNDTLGGNIDNDTLYGGEGRDTIQDDAPFGRNPRFPDYTPSPDTDRASGGADNDRIDVHDGYTDDVVSCGEGRDIVRFDKIGTASDKLEGCEVRYPNPD